MNWQETLAAASGVSQDAGGHIPALVALLREAEAGSAEAAHVERVYDSDLWQVPFVVALDRGIRSSERDRWPTDALGAARACLRFLPSLLDSLRTITIGCTVPPDRVTSDLTALVVAAATDTSREAEARSLGESRDRATCTRCASVRTETRTTTAVRPALTEIRCDACGNMESGARDGPRGWAPCRDNVPSPTA